jgi:HEAT repeat protein
MAAMKPNVAALVEQMPETDRDIQARADEAKRQAQPDSPDTPRPQPIRLGAASKFTGPDPDAAERIFMEILSGGRQSILELLALVREPGDADYKNYKAGYVLHGLVIRAGRVGQESQRRLLAGALASELGSDKHSKAVKAVFIRELRILGGKESVSALGRQLLDEALCSDAALALLTIRDGAAAQFRGALARAQGQNRVTLIQALGFLQDVDSTAALKKALGEQDPNVRRAAAWALANLGEASATDALLASADRAEGWKRTEATRHCLLLAERLAASGKQSRAHRIFAHLHATRTDPSERHIREITERALGIGRP